jgi:BirA family biotin operon repressor/biotin-[acetyl-CoA-carboxylase] ligase
MTPSMSGVTLGAELARSPRPWTIEVHERLGSTNARALQLARPWHVVVTEHQTQGRGRLERPWHTPAGVALTVSATVELGPSPNWLPLVAGLAVVQALDESAGLVTALKWPNDVLVPSDADRKVCGILCETHAAPAGETPVAVLGIGVNLTQTRAELPVPEATSVALAGGGVSREELLVRTLERLAGLLQELTAGGESARGVHAAYRARSATIGADVRVARPGAGDLLGRAVAVDDTGCLVVRDAGGREHVFAAGDVTHVRQSGAGHPRLT